MSFQSQTETLSFEGEVKQLLHLVTHSLYSNDEIFLRELISNSSDAEDKLAYQALSDAALYEGDTKLKIWVDIDKDSRAITIRDNGIGMSREEVIENLGTIAKSGTRAFRELLTEKKAKESQLIGQFGVGFYSAFIVADRVIVLTRRAGIKADQGVEWESNGEGEYTVKNINKPSRGTEVILYLKKEKEEFLDAMRLRSIITKYSDHILRPIVMKNITTNGGKTKDKKESEEEVVNRSNALWALPKNKIKDEEYKELYKHISHDFKDPLAWTHNRVEGKLEYTTLLYLPERASFDLWNRERRGRYGLKLYVKRVFIMDDAEHFIPMYLRFIKGIVDSNDLPLNISRELLQSNNVINKIKTGCVKRVLSLLEELTNDKEKYSKFWKAFGHVLKEGLAEDFSNRDRICNLLRFASTHNNNEEENVTLRDYISRMKPRQDKIYYIISDTYLTAKNSPLLEVFRKKGIEVLLMHDRVDEWLVAHLTEFNGKSLQSVAKGTLCLGELEKAGKELDKIIKQLKEILSDKVKEVRITNRLTDSPSCVVFDENEMSGHLQRLLLQTGQEFIQEKPILEINPIHPLILRVKNESNKERLNRWAELLLNQALLAEGEQLKNPSEFVKAVNALLLDL